MVLILKLISLVVLIYGGVQVFSGIKEVEEKNEKIKKVGIGSLIIVIGLMMFPSWSNKDVKAQEWAHTRFREVYWNSADLVEKSSIVISSNVFYLDDPDSETRQAYKQLNEDLGTEYVEKSSEEVEKSFNEIDTELKEAQKKIKENKVPWYLTNGIYKKGKKIMKLQSEQLELIEKQSKGFQRKGNKFFGDSFKIEKKIEKIDSQINDILEEDNILYY